jgi:hypothetical protein
VTRLLACVVILALAAGTAAADEIAVGAVTKIEEREIYVNLGAGRGLVTGASIRLKRPVSLRHPVTRKAITDWVPLGAARLTAVGRQLSMAVLDADLVAQVRVGDRVEVYVVIAEEPQERPLEPDHAAPPEEKLPEVDPETAAILALWRQMSGQPVDARIAGWERFLAANPRSMFAASLREDIAELRRVRDAIRGADAAFESPVLGGLGHAAPEHAASGEAAPLAFLVEDPDTLSTAWLHYRKAGAISYKRALLAREGDLYLRGAIPAEVVDAPGVEYFVEVARTDGTIGTAVGTPKEPVQVQVDRPSIANAFVGGDGRSRATLRSSVLDFATFDARGGDRTDFFTMVEADFAYRVTGWLSAVRSGFGAVHGRGGFADRVYTEDTPAPAVGFNYGYAEVEVQHPGGRVGLALRGIGGVGREGFGLGVEGRLRVGDPDTTNVTLGSSRIAELGFLSELRLQVEAIRKAPLGFTVAVTDQPNEGDLGMLFAADVGWRVLEWLAPRVRVSYQARTVVHSGAGAGIGLVFGW